MKSVSAQHVPTVSHISIPPHASTQPQDAHGGPDGNSNQASSGTRSDACQLAASPHNLTSPLRGQFSSWDEKLSDNHQNTPAHNLGLILHSLTALPHPAHSVSHTPLHQALLHSAHDSHSPSPVSVLSCTPTAIELGKRQGATQHFCPCLLLKGQVRLRRD